MVRVQFNCKVCVCIAEMYPIQNRQVSKQACTIFVYHILDLKKISHSVTRSKVKRKQVRRLRRLYIMNSHILAIGDNIPYKSNILDITLVIKCYIINERNEAHLFITNL